MIRLKRDWQTSKPRSCADKVEEHKKTQLPVPVLPAVDTAEMSTNISLNAADVLGKIRDLQQLHNSICKVITKLNYEDDVVMNYTNAQLVDIRDWEDDDDASDHYDDEDYNDEYDNDDYDDDEYTDETYNSSIEQPFYPRTKRNYRRATRNGFFRVYDKSLLVSPKMKFIVSRWPYLTYMQKREVIHYFWHPEFRHRLNHWRKAGKVKNAALTTMLSKLRMNLVGCPATDGYLPWEYVQYNNRKYPLSWCKEQKDPGYKKLFASIDDMNCLTEDDKLSITNYIQKSLAFRGTITSRTRSS